MADGRSEYLTETKAAERAAMAVQSKINVHALPVRAFLDHSVAPALLEGFALIARERYALRHPLPTAPPHTPLPPPPQQT